MQINILKKIKKREREKRKEEDINIFKRNCLQLEASVCKSTVLQIYYTFTKPQIPWKQLCYLTRTDYFVVSEQTYFDHNHNY